MWCAQAGGPKRGKTTFCHNLARLLANMADECKPQIFEEECDGDFTTTRVCFLMEGDQRLPFQYTLLVRPPFSCQIVWISCVEVVGSMW